MSDLAAAVADRPPLRVVADLSVTVERTEFAVAADGDRLRVAFDSVPALVRVARAGAGRGRLHRLNRLLDAAGLTAELLVDGRTIGLLGAAAEPGPLGRRLGGVELRSRDLLAAAVTRR